MSSGKGANTQPNGATDPPGFAHSSGIFAVGSAGMKMTYSQVVETLRACVYVGAPEELRERILWHVRNHCEPGTECDHGGDHGPPEA